MSYKLVILYVIGMEVPMSRRNLNDVTFEKIPVLKCDRRSLESKASLTVQVNMMVKSDAEIGI